jgi:cyclophilin family peptidyl-prolyl cis-trans isomerase
VPLRRFSLLVLAALALAGCGGEDGGEEAGQQVPPPAADGCRDVQAPPAKPEGTLDPPQQPLDASATTRAIVRTTCGDFTITLDPRAAPTAAASFAALAERDFFDNTVFHRIVPGFVIQGGDPTATGGGGPGYRTVDTPAQETVYTRGVVAMAKAATDPPGAAGSQFFVVTAQNAGLPPEYAVIGRVTDGMDVVLRIEALGDPATELPTQPVVVEGVEIVRS